jgi:hypothetical protein
VAEDSPAKQAEIPPQKRDDKTVAKLQFDMIVDAPYKYTSDDVLFHVYALRNHINGKDLVPERVKFFSKGQACLRASPLTKRYGWGIHNDAYGKIALYAMESDEYKRLSQDASLQHVKAMKSKR